MFASLVLPFQITAVLFLVVLVVSNLWVRKGKFVVLSLLAGVLLFIPSCVGVMAVVDAFRYGKFEYATASEINQDPYIELPPNAKQIVLHRNSGRHIARFEIGTEELLAWLEKMRALRPDLNPKQIQDKAFEVADKRGRKEMLASRSDWFADEFFETEWEFDPEMRKYHVMRSDRGGGYSVWHAPDSGVAYLNAGYW